MTYKGVVHMKEDRRIYVGRSGEMLVNRMGFATIKEAAIAQHAQQNSAPVISISPAINSIEVNGTVSVADASAAEKRRSVHLAPQTLYTIPTERVTRSQTQPPPPHQPPLLHKFGPTSFIPFAPNVEVPHMPVVPALTGDKVVIKEP